MSTSHTSCEDTQKVLSILDQAWKELVDLKQVTPSIVDMDLTYRQLRLAYTIVSSQMRRDTHKTTAVALQIERFLAGLTLPKMAKVDSLSGKGNRTI